MRAPHTQGTTGNKAGQTPKKKGTLLIDCFDHFPSHTSQPENNKDGCVCVGTNDKEYPNPNLFCDELSPCGASQFCWGTLRCDGVGTCKDSGECETVRDMRGGKVRRGPGRKGGRPTGGVGGRDRRRRNRRLQRGGGRRNLPSFPFLLRDT